MNVLTIFIFVLIIVLIYVVYTFMTTPTTTVSDLSDASKYVVVPSSKTESNSTGNNNYGYSVWLYIDAWKTNGTSTINKNILTRTTTTTTSANLPLFQLHLDNNQNDLMLEMSDSTGAPINVPCMIRNVQLQKWINITMSVYGNTVDLYLDGKLVRTCVMTKMPASLISTDQLYVGGGYTLTNNVISPTDGDLQGFISNVVYNPDYFSPEEAWNIYSAGYSGAGMFNFLHSYKLNFSITNNNQTLGQFSI
jgi:hypothetical protein